MIIRISTLVNFFCVFEFVRKNFLWYFLFATNKSKVCFVYSEKKIGADKIDSWVKLDRDNVSG